MFSVLVDLTVACYNFSETKITESGSDQIIKVVYCTRLRTCWTGQELLKSLYSFLGESCKFSMSTIITIIVKLVFVF